MIRFTLNPTFTYKSDRIDQFYITMLFSVVLSRSFVLGLIQLCFKSKNVYTHGCNNS